MKVSLFDLDITSRRRPFPNLALMKLSTYHKSKGDEVFFNFPLCNGELTYASCVFPWNIAKAKNRLPHGAILGGTGFDLHFNLSTFAEHLMPDYDLYQADFSLGFTSRGCPRHCPWCLVSKKEGPIKSWARIYEFWNREHRKIVLLDNNFLAAPNWQTTMEDLLAENLEVDFNQGLDIRLLNDKNMAYLKRLKTKYLRFAFDDISYEKAVRHGIALLLDNGINIHKLVFYVLIGFHPNLDEAIERMKILKSLDVAVYPMIYKDSTGKEPRLGGKFTETIFWHGSRANLRKFLRVTGRLT